MYFFATFSNHQRRFFFGHPVRRFGPFDFCQREHMVANAANGSAPENQPPCDRNGEKKDGGAMGSVSPGKGKEVLHHAGHEITVPKTNSEIFFRK